jgi:uncharacterized protein YdaU (DUF1376 family)
MNYYKRHLGDYAKDTKHLSLTEHGAFTLLLDYYYATEKPIPDDRCERIAGASTPSEIAAVRAVLKEFFVLEDGAWRNSRCDSLLAESSEKSGKARASAGAKWGDSSAAATRAQRLAAARAIAKHTAAEWNALNDACGNACVRCGAAGVVKDHITPIYQGGSDGIENLQPLCTRCNSSKGPENKDFRPSNWAELLQERLQERLRNACETPASHKPLAISHKKAEKQPRTKEKDLTLAEWVLALPDDEEVIVDTDPIFDWALKIGVPRDWVALAWFAFESRYGDNPKRYTDWRAVFRKALREDWLKLWRKDSRTGGWVLTPAGEMAERERQS